MLCKRCPHLVRHGLASSDGRQIEFRNMCGLVMKASFNAENGNEVPNKKGPKKSKPAATKEPEKEQICLHHPFPKIFDYMECRIYQETFKSATRKNDVVPTKDIQYSDILSGNSITDMELL